MAPSAITTGIIGLAMYLVLGASPWPSAAQTTGREVPAAVPQRVPAWQTAAGGKMEFEVASIRPSPGRLTKMNFPWAEGAPYPQNGGYFSADTTLLAYIWFAYKLSQAPEQTRLTLERTPKWLDSQHFAVQARAPGNPTKDQMRLMMQSLLAERCKLVVHFESREMQVLALTLVEPGKTGPKLRRHIEDPPCDFQGTPSAQNPSARKAEVFPLPCGRFYIDETPDNLQRLGARNVTMQRIATSLADVGQLGHPAIDQTRLSGTFDFSIDWEPLPNGPRPPDADEQPFLSRLPLERALKDQLGLKLVKQKAPVRFLVIDHVEKPSEN